MENIESVEKGQIDKVTNHCTEAMEINTWKRRERWYTHLVKDRKILRSQIQVLKSKQYL